jgi:hypothetical protein
MVGASRVSSLRSLPNAIQVLHTTNQNLVTSHGRTRLPIGKRLVLYSEWMKTGTRVMMGSARFVTCFESESVAPIQHAGLRE